MACYHPLEGYIGENGKLVFTPDKSKFGYKLKVPCRQCLGCRIAYRKEWGIRAMHEAQMHEQNMFITMTYATENLPSDLNLDHEHWQKFIKSLRKRTGLKIRYLMCGEYGPRTHRPHFHALIFGYWPEDAKTWRNSNGNKIYRSEFLEEIWDKGFVEFGSVTQQSAEYVAGYVHKKVKGLGAKAHYTITDEETGEEIGYRKPEYARMSLKPGIGQSWIEKYHKDVFPQDQVTMIGGYTAPAPAYYRKWLKENNPELHEELRQKRIKEAKLDPENTPERLEQREKVAAAKQKFKLLRTRHES